MKKIFKTFSIFSFLLISKIGLAGTFGGDIGGGTGSTTGSTGGDSNSCPSSEICFSNPIKADSLQCFMKDLLKMLAEIGSIFVVLALVYAGFLLVTSRGNENKLITGKKTLMWAIIGGAIVLGAWALSIGVASTIGEITGAEVNVEDICSSS